MQLNPLSEFVTGFLQKHDSKQDILAALIVYVDTLLRLKIDPHYFATLELPAHLVCHFQVQNQHKTVAVGDDLGEIKHRLIPKSSARQDMFNLVKEQLQPQVKYIEQKK